VQYCGVPIFLARVVWADPMRWLPYTTARRGIARPERAAWPATRASTPRHAPRAPRAHVIPSDKTHFIHLTKHSKFCI